jgi:hypothetical protein
MDPIVLSSFGNVVSTDADDDWQLIKANRARSITCFSHVNEVKWFNTIRIYEDVRILCGLDQVEVLIQGSSTEVLKSTTRSGQRILCNSPNQESRFMWSHTERRSITNIDKHSTTQSWLVWCPDACNRGALRSKLRSFSHAILYAPHKGWRYGRTTC